eukprot:scaffold121674_cov63-Phaeocystis_antarctica.AAC.2
MRSGCEVALCSTSSERACSSRPYSPPVTLPSGRTRHCSARGSVTTAPRGAADGRGGLRTAGASDAAGEPTPASASASASASVSASAEARSVHTPALCVGKAGRACQPSPTRTESCCSATAAVATAAPCAAAPCACSERSSPAATTTGSAHPRTRQRSSQPESFCSCSTFCGSRSASASRRLGAPSSLSASALASSRLRSIASDKDTSRGGTWHMSLSMPARCSCSCSTTALAASSSSHACAARDHTSTSAVTSMCAARCRPAPGYWSAFREMSLRRRLASGNRGLRAQSRVKSTPCGNETFTLTLPAACALRRAAAAGAAGSAGLGKEVPKVARLAARAGVLVVSAGGGAAAAPRPAATSLRTRSCSIETEAQIASSTVAETLTSPGRSAARFPAVPPEGASRRAITCSAVGESSWSRDSSSPTSGVAAAASAAAVAAACAARASCSYEARRRATVTGSACEASVATRQSTPVTSRSSCCDAAALMRLPPARSRRHTPTCAAAAATGAAAPAGSEAGSEAGAGSSGGSSNQSSHAHSASLTSSARPSLRGVTGGSPPETAAAAAPSPTPSLPASPIAASGDAGAAPPTPSPFATSSALACDARLGSRLRRVRTSLGSRLRTQRSAAPSDEGASATRMGSSARLSCSGVPASPASDARDEAAWPKGLSAV